MAKRKSAPPPPPRTPPRPPSRVPSVRTIGVVLALGAIVRFAATCNDLWLDEIWTLTLIAGLHSPLEIVTTLHHDNNHVLNTLFMYVLRPIAWDWLYRLPSLIAGVATVLIAVDLAARLDGPGDDATATQTRRLMAAIVFSASYPMLHYGSEARGYALALAFGLGAVAIAVRDGLRPRSPNAPRCWVALVLAMLSHALTLHVLAALVAWGAVHVLRRDGFRSSLGTLAWWFLVPTAAFGVFYWGFLQGITVGGGNREGVGPPLQRALAVASGLPLAMPLGALLALVLAVAAAGLVVLARRGSDLWVLLAVGIVVSPLALAVLQPTNLYAERYFLVSMMLWLLLVAHLLAWLTTRGTAGTATAAIVLAAFVVANGVRVAALLQDGRGSYRAALQYVADHTRAAVAEVGSDHDFRNRLVVEHFAPMIAKPLRYRMREAEPSAGPEWYVAHRSFGEAPPASRLMLSRGTYRLERAYPTGMLSGFAWFVYTREPSGPR